MDFTVFKSRQNKQKTIRKNRYAASLISFLIKTKKPKTANAVTKKYDTAKMPTLNRSVHLVQRKTKSNLDITLFADGIFMPKRNTATPQVRTSVNAKMRLCSNAALNLIFLQQSRKHTQLKKTKIVSVPSNLHNREKAPQSPARKTWISFFSR